MDAPGTAAQSLVIVTSEFIRHRVSYFASSQAGCYDAKAVELHLDRVDRLQEGQDQQSLHELNAALYQGNLRDLYVAAEQTDPLRREALTDHVCECFLEAMHDLLGLLQQQQQQQQHHAGDQRCCFLIAEQGQATGRHPCEPEDSR